MVKRCQWGLCNSDSRYPDRLECGVYFIPFPKPKRSLDKCLRWIKACGRPYQQLNTSVIDGNYHMFVCSKHFPDGKPTEKYPDPFPAAPASCQSCTPVRPPPKRRTVSEPPVSRKKRRALLELDTCAVENTNQHNEKSTECSTETASTQKEISPLDLLALAAENNTLKQQVEMVQSTLHQQLAEQILKNEELMRENANLRKERTSKETKTKPRPVFSVETVKNSPIRDNFKFYTGFTYKQFMCIFTFLEPISYVCPINFPSHMKSIFDVYLQDQLLLTLVKLRLNLQFKHLAYLFNISPQDAGRLFRQWINYMFGSVPIWPHRDVIKENMPEGCKNDFPNTIIILDGTEIKVQKPSNLKNQSQCYSDYKSSTTLKGLVGADPRGSFTFISLLFSGTISDKEITIQSGLIGLLQQLLECGHVKTGDGIMVDKGFFIKKEIEELGLKLYIPPFAPGSGQMTAGEVALTRKIARHRVHVERAISRAKKFKNCCK